MTSSGRLTADLVLVNGVVHTLDPKMVLASAIAVKSGRIAAIGSDAEIEALADDRTQAIDAKGRAVLPGFIDGHTHFQKGALSRLLSVDYLELAPSSLDEVVRHVKQRAADLAPGEWIRGDALNEHRLIESRLPTRWELDAAAPDHPVILLTVGNHSIAANSLALHLAGITKNTHDPPGGRIERDEHAEPTGHLSELGKLRLDPNRVDSIVPRYSIQQRMDALRAGFPYLHANGVTSIHEIVMDPLELRAYQRLHADGALGVRVSVLIRVIESKIELDHVTGIGLEQGLGDEWLRIGGVKMSVDGSTTTHGAAIYEDYPGEPGNSGLVRIPQDQLDELVAESQSHGIRVAIHAVGQRAVDMALSAIEKADASFSRGGLRHRIEHAYLPPKPGQIHRISQLGLSVATQPSLLAEKGWIDGSGSGSLRGAMPLRSLLDAGVPVIGSSDYPCVAISPFLGLAAAVTRKDGEGRIVDSVERISVAEAVDMYTRQAAYGGYDEISKGAITPGKVADFIVLSADPYAVSPGELASIQPHMTVVGGRVVYRSAQF